MIWDLHGHLSGVSGRTPDERMATLMQYADRMGIDRLIVFMGYPFLTNPSPTLLREQNDQVLQALSHWHHRAFGFVYLSGEHVEFSLEELDRCVGKGPMVGIKLWVAKRCHSTDLDAIVERAVELNAVVFQHTWFKVGGNLAGESTPADLAALAARHPKAKIIAGHCGGDWELGIGALRASANVSVGMGGFDPTAGAVEMAVRELGAHRVFFGSDVGGRSFASQLAKVTGAAVSDRAKQRILGENLREMLMPILRAKGVRL
jgi:hypothetical protein